MMVGLFFVRHGIGPERSAEILLDLRVGHILCLCDVADQLGRTSQRIRTEQLGPIVLFSDLCECFPYDDSVYMLRVTGGQFKRMISHMVRDEVWEGAHCEFYQLSSGLRVEYDKEKHSFNHFDFNGEPVEDGKIYKVGLQKYHYINFEEFFNVPFDEISANGKPVIVSTSCCSVFDEYLSTHQNLDREVTGRLIIK